MQAVAALVEDHVRVDLPPLTTVDGAAVRVTTGAAAVTPPPVTVTVTGVEAVLPPAPLQVKVKVVVAVNAADAFEPLSATTLLVVPSLSEQEFAFVELHVNVVVAPGATAVGVALSVAVGALGAIAIVTSADTVSLLPPAPVHMSENTVEPVRGALVYVPLAACAPVQEPEAVHAVALVEFHVSVVVPPGAMLTGFAARVAVGTMLTVTDAAGLVPPAPAQVSA
jgi:hypothetical protein